MIITKFGRGIGTSSMSSAATSFSRVGRNVASANDFAPRAESQHADPRGIDFPFGRAAANDPHRPLGILPGMHIERIGRIFFTRQAILQHKRGHAQLVEILGGFGSFGLITPTPDARRRESPAPPRRGFLRWWQKHRERGIVNVLHPIVLGLLGFVAAIFKARCAVLPQRNHLRLRRTVRSRAQRAQHQQNL